MIAAGSQVAVHTAALGPGLGLGLLKTSGMGDTAREDLALGD